jgi:hypothetical protein
MLKERTQAAQAVAEAFLAAEQAMDVAAARAAECAALMLKARADMKLPLGTGVQALAIVAEASALAIRSRQLMIEAHPAMAELPADIGLRHVAIGDTKECPPIENRGAATERRLSLVG